MTGRSAARAVVAFREAMLHALRVKLAERPVLSDSRRLQHYLTAEMAERTTEQFRVLYLDRHNRLIRDVVISDGTLSEAPTYPREVVAHALELGAANLILVHNHPSGKGEPSSTDVRYTRRLVETVTPLDLCIVDHVIVARDGCTSMRAAGLM